MSDLYACLTQTSQNEYYVKGADSFKFRFPVSNSKRAPFCKITAVQAVVETTIDTYAEKSITLKLNVPSYNYFSNDRKEAPAMCLLIPSTEAQHYILGYEPNYSVRTRSNFEELEIKLEDPLGLTIPTSEVEHLNVLFRVDYLEQNEIKEEVISSYRPSL